jgi:protease-4
MFVQSYENSKTGRLHPLAFVFLFSLSTFFFVLIAAIILIFANISGKMGSSFSWKSPSQSYIGVIEITGAIFDSKKTLARLEKAAEDKTIKAVVLRLNSPGGAVGPSQEIYDAVVSYPKPLVVSMASVAASGAFYIACGAKKVFANPGTITGSIGVIMEFANLEGLYEWAKIRRYVIKSGKYKDAGSEYRELTEEEKSLFTKMIMNVLDQFKTAIQKGRNLSAEAVNEIADGRIFSGEQAKHLGLIDNLGGYQDAVNEAAQMVNIKGKPHVVFVGKQRKPWLEWFFDDPTAPEESSFIDKLSTAVNKTGLTRSTGIYFLLPGS